MNKKLKYTDFKINFQEENNKLPYFEYREDYKIIKIKPSMDGFIVSVKVNDKYPEPATSTNLNNGINPKEAFKKALHLAQKFYNKYFI